MKRDLINRVVGMSRERYVGLLGALFAVIVGLVVGQVFLEGASGLDDVMYVSDVSLFRQLFFLPYGLVAFWLGLHISWLTVSRKVTYGDISVIFISVVLLFITDFSGFYNGVIVGGESLDFGYLLTLLVYVVCFPRVFTFAIYRSRDMFDSIRADVVRGDVESGRVGITFGGVWRLIGLSIVLYVLLANIVQVVLIGIGLDVTVVYASIVFVVSVAFGIHLLDKYLSMHVYTEDNVEAYVEESVEESVEDSVESTEVRK